MRSLNKIAPLPLMAPNRRAIPSNACLMLRAKRTHGGHRKRLPWRRRPGSTNQDLGRHQAVRDGCPGGNAPAAALLFRGDLLEDTQLASSASQRWLIEKHNDIRNVAITSCVQALHSSSTFDSIEAVKQVAWRLTFLDPLCEIGHQAL